MNKIRLLVVEDDSESNELICKTLENEGYETESAYSGSEALLRISMETFDILLLDLMIPGINGEGVIRRLRQEGNLIPIIVLSDQIPIEEKVAILNMGEDDYLIKPFEKDEVVSRVNTKLWQMAEY